MTTYNAGNLSCADLYGAQIGKLIEGERFVVVFSGPLSCDEQSHQPKIYIDDLFTGRIVFSESEGMAFFYLLDLAGVDLDIGLDGMGIDEFGAWMASTFYKQYAGLLESAWGGEVAEVETKSLIDSSDTPDLWLLRCSGLTSLLIFDPYELTYQVLFTWVEGFNETMPANLEEAVEGLEPKRLKDLLKQYRAGDDRMRARLIGKILEAR